jgi:hypothetical protein
MDLGILAPRAIGYHLVAACPGTMDNQATASIQFSTILKSLSSYVPGLYKSAQSGFFFGPCCF